MDYELIDAGDEVSSIGLLEMLKAAGNGHVQLRIKKQNGEERTIAVKHTISEDQAGFILAGSALNLLAKKGQIQD